MNFKPDSSTVVSVVVGVAIVAVVLAVATCQEVYSDVGGKLTKTAVIKRSWFGKGKATIDGTLNAPASTTAA